MSDRRIPDLPEDPAAGAGVPRVPRVHARAAFRPHMFKLDFGRVFSQTFSIWARNLVPFTFLSVVVLSPLLVLQLVYFHAHPDLAMGMPVDPADGPQYLRRVAPFFAAVGGLRFLILFPILSGALTYGVVEELSDRHRGLGQCFTVGLRKALWVLGVSVVVGIIEFFGTILLVIPGIIAAMTLCVATQAAVVEGTGMGSLQRSSDLTRGNRWTILGVFIVLILVAWLIGTVLGLGGVAMGGSQFSPARTTFTFLVEAITTVFTAILPAVIYYELRTGKEGTSSEELARVFE